MRARLAVVAAIARLGYQAAPGWMVASTALAVTSGVVVSLYPFSFQYFVDRASVADGSGIAIAAALVGGLLTVYWLAAVLDANVGFGFVDPEAYYDPKEYLAELARRRSVAVAVSEQPLAEIDREG